MLLSLIWGLNFLLIKIAVEEVGALATVFYRLFFASFILFIIMKWHNQKLDFRPQALLNYALLGFLGQALPFFLISSAELHIDAGLAGVLMSPMPLFTLILSAIILKNQNLTFRIILGFFFGFIGVLILFGFGPLSKLGRGDMAQLLAQIATILAAFSYGLCTVVTKMVIGQINMSENSIALPTGATFAALLIISPCYLFFAPVSFELFSLVSTTSIAIQALMATAIATLIYIRIVEIEGPVFLSLINFIIPLVAYFSGAILLDEKVEINVLIALGIILFSLYLSKKQPS